MTRLVPFDLEKAKAGATFTHQSDPENVTKRTFLAKRSDGIIIYEYNNGEIVSGIVDPMYLRMVIESNKMRIRIYKGPGGHAPIDEPLWLVYERRGWVCLKEFEIEYDDNE